MHDEFSFGLHDSAGNELDEAWRRELLNLTEQYEQARRHALRQTSPRENGSAHLGSAALLRPEQGDWPLSEPGVAGSCRTERPEQGPIEVNRW
jgi:hypothetical protein